MKHTDIPRFKTARLTSAVKHTDIPRFKTARLTIAVEDDEGTVAVYDFPNLDLSDPGHYIHLNTLPVKVTGRSTLKAGAEKFRVPLPEPQILEVTLKALLGTDESGRTGTVNVYKEPVEAELYRDKPGVTQKFVEAPSYPSDL